mgnify:FL=1
MSKKYPVVTLCGSTRFKDLFMQVQKELTLKGKIIIYVGLFGHSGDEEVWENMSEGELTATKLMLDDMHKDKINMADEIFVINPGGYIGSSTWSEICYADMTGKPIGSLEPISENEIFRLVKEHVKVAEEEAAKQCDVFSHDSLNHSKDMVTFEHMGKLVVDPWLTDIETADHFAGYEGNVPHGDKNGDFDPFKKYGAKTMARFVESIVQKKEQEEAMNSTDNLKKNNRREEMIKEIKWYHEQLGQPLSEDFPDGWSDEQLAKHLENLDEFDPCGDLN